MNLKYRIKIKGYLGLAFNFEKRNPAKKNNCIGSFVREFDYFSQGLGTEVQ